MRLADRSAFDDHLLDPDSRFGDRLFSNLATLPTSALELRAEPRTAELSAARAAELVGGWSQQVHVTSRLEHDVGPASHRVWLEIAPGPGGPRLVGLDQSGLDDSDRSGSARPLWLLQPIRVVTGPDATVIVGGRSDRTGWLSRAEDAERAVRKRLADAAEDRWTAGLVVELPSSERAFEQVLGVEPGSYRQIAAVAWSEGADPTRDAVRVVVNPAAAASLDDQRLGVLLTHEATHVLTRSASSPAPMWLVEGFADWVAFDRVPRAAPPSEQQVLADVRRHGAPAAFPTDREFAPDAADLDLTYGRSWLLCRFVADSWSEDDLVRLYAQVDGGAAASAAVPEVLGIDERTLLRRWRGWLEREAGR